MDEEVFSDFDFSNLCRFCLTKDVEMMDLFETGIYDAITSATRLELSRSDELPRSICLRCKTQTEEIYEFVSLVRSSDDRLSRAGTGRDRIVEESGKADPAKESGNKKEEEELFLVVVPESEGSPSDPSGLEEKFERSRPRAGPIESYSCNSCSRLFPDVPEFLNHFGRCRMTSGEIRVPSECPMCGVKTRATFFADHLMSHRKEGTINVFKLNGSSDEGWKIIFKSDPDGGKSKKDPNLCRKSSRDESRNVPVVCRCPVCPDRRTDDPSEKKSRPSPEFPTPELNVSVSVENKCCQEFCCETFQTEPRTTKRSERLYEKFTIERDENDRPESENGFHKYKTSYRRATGKKSLNRCRTGRSDPKFSGSEIRKLPPPSTRSGRRRNRAGVASGSDVRNSGFPPDDGHSFDPSRSDSSGTPAVFGEGRSNEADRVPPGVELRPKNKTGECSLCGKRLSTGQSLRLHTRRHLERGGILCPECGKCFFEERNYRRHLLTHRGIRPHLCDYPGCGKSFYTLFEIKRHKKYHFDTRDFPCSYCNKKFHESNHLKVHVRTHTGEKPYVCPHCPKGFVTRTRCKQHIKLIHRGEGYDLIVTDISKKVPVFPT